MTITEFTPWASLLGGLMIGVSALVVLFFFGRVAGISGITSAGLLSHATDKLWRIAFLVGLIFAPVLLQLFNADSIGMPMLKDSTISTNLLWMSIAGLAVGIGTVFGSGCTSGHGVCGLGRLSGRSLVAVVTFMVSAILTVVLIRHVLQLSI